MKNKKPVHQVRIDSMKAAIWENEGRRGTFYSVGLTRLYRVDGKWEETTSFSGRDLGAVARVLKLVADWIHEHEVKPEQPE